jgi:hypothetical protein
MKEKVTSYSNICYVPYEEERVDGERRVADRLQQEVPLCHSP